MAVAPSHACVSCCSKGPCARCSSCFVARIQLYDCLRLESCQLFNRLCISTAGRLQGCGPHMLLSLQAHWCTRSPFDTQLAQLGMCQRIVAEEGRLILSVLLSKWPATNTT